MEVELTNKAVKQYERLKDPILSQITIAIDKLEFDPPDGDIEKLEDKTNEYRLRVRDKRILFSVEKRIKTDGTRENYILIHRIASRGQVYKK